MRYLPEVIMLRMCTRLKLLRCREVLRVSEVGFTVCPFCGKTRLNEVSECAVGNPQITVAATVLLV